MNGLIFLQYISLFSAILPIAAAWYNFRNLDKVLKIVAFFFLISGLFDLGLVLLSSCFHVRNTAFMVHVFIWISIVFFARIYYVAFSKTLFKQVCLVLSVVTGIAVLGNAVWGEGIMVYPSFSNTVEGIMLIILSLLYFYQLFDRQEFVYIEKQGLFWINAGVLVYFAINIFLFMLINRLHPAHIKNFWVIHSIINTIANILYATGLLCKPQKKA